MDYICLEKIRLTALIGTEPQERFKARPLELSVRIGLDLEPAGRDDDLTRSINYAEVTARLVALAAASQYYLLEALAERCAALVLEYPPVHSVTLRLVKPAVFSEVDQVAVELTRERRSV